MEQRGDVDWQRVKEVHDSFKYSHSGLGAGAQLAIAIVMAAVVGPMATGAWGTVGGAAATSLATTGATSIVSNKGDLGVALKDTFSSDSLKNAAVAGATAGLMEHFFDEVLKTKTDSVTGKVTVELGSLEGIGRFAGNQLAQGGTAAALNQLMGRDVSFRDALQSALYNTLAAAAFNAVGDYTEGKWVDGSPQKVAIHAIVGGLLSEATGGEFKTGAIAAGANEALVVQLDALVNSNEALLTMSSQLVGLVAAAAVDGDIEKGAWVAQNATQYNFLNHSDSKDFDAAMKECGSDEACQRKEWEREFSKLSQANIGEAMATGGAVWAKDQMGQIAAGLEVLGSVSCSTPTCEQYKFTLIDRAMTGYTRLAEVVGEWEPILGAVVGVAAGIAGSRPAGNGTRPPGSNPTVGSSQIQKAYDYWAKVKAEGGAKGGGFAGEITSITQKQLDKKFKHASDFGVVTTKKNPETLAQFESAIKTHMSSTSTVQQGTYGFVKDSKVFFNAATNNAVVVDGAGNFVTGFKLAPGTQQFENFIKNGVLR